MSAAWAQRSERGISPTPDYSGMRTRYSRLRLMQKLNTLKRQLEIRSMQRQLNVLCLNPERLPR